VDPCVILARGKKRRAKPKIGHPGVQKVKKYEQKEPLNRGMLTLLKGTR